MDINVIPVGTVSITVTVPLVAPAPAAFDTITEYVALACPRFGLPTCDFAILNCGNAAAVITVRLLAVALSDPPPETTAVFTRGDNAFPATLTVTVTGG
jgi:hypothetical protein